MPAGDTGAEADGPGAGGCGGVSVGGDVFLREIEEYNYAYEYF